MSAPSSSQYSAQAEQLWLATNYGNVCTLVVWLCEWLDTLPQEIETIWSSPLSVGTMLFLANRYGALVFQVITLGFSLPLGHATHSTCTLLFNVSQILMIMTLTTTSLLLAHRILAMYGRNKALVITLGAFVVGWLCLQFYFMTLVTVVTTKDTIFRSISQCTVVSATHIELDANGSLLSNPADYMRSHAQAVLIRFIAGAAIPFVFDTVVFSLTIKKTLRHAAEMRKLRLASGITELLLRDGFLYYIAVMALDLVQGFMDIHTMLSQHFAREALECSVPVFFVVLPNVIVNHLVLNLRRFRPTERSLVIKSPEDVTLREYREYNISAASTVDHALPAILSAVGSHGQLQEEDSGTQRRQDLNWARLTDVEYGHVLQA